MPNMMTAMLPHPLGPASVRFRKCPIFGIAAAPKSERSESKFAFECWERRSQSLADLILNFL